MVASDLRRPGKAAPGTAWRDDLDRAIAACKRVGRIPSSRRPPFDPEVAVAACTAVLRRFGVNRVVGDRYAGEWPKARFAEHGIAFEQAARPKSDLYCDLLPLLNAKRVEQQVILPGINWLGWSGGRLDQAGTRLITRLAAADDLVNAVAGVLVGLDAAIGGRRQVKQSDMLDAGRPIKISRRRLPGHACVSKRLECVHRCARQKRYTARVL